MAFLKFAAAKEWRCTTQQALFPAVALVEWQALSSER